MRAHSFLCLAVIVCITGLLFASSAKAAEVEWKYFSYWQSGDDPTKLHKAFAEDIEKASNGRFVIKVFSAGEMPYTSFDVLKVVARNQVQIADVAYGSVAGDVPELNAFSMPFVCNSMEDFFTKAAPAVEGTLNEVLAKRYKVQSLFQWVVGAQQMWLVNPVANLDGLKGLKIRAWNREQVEMMRLLGASGVTITPAEVIPALQRGVADGAFTAATPALGWKFHEVCKFAYMLNLSLAHQSIVYNQAAFDKTNRKLLKSSVAAQSLSGLMMPVMGLVSNIGFVAICTVGGVLLANGSFGSPEDALAIIMSFIIYLKLFQSPMGQIAQAANQLQSTAAAAERVFELLDAENQSDESHKTAPGISCGANPESLKKPGI